MAAGAGGQDQSAAVCDRRDVALADVAEEPRFRHRDERARARGELDRIEQESLAFFERTRQRYQELAAQDPAIITIDASQTLEQVASDVGTTLELWLKEQEPSS